MNRFRTVFYKDTDGTKPLGTFIKSLRKEESGDIVRILYFFDKGRIILCTNGFVKKQQKTPRSEIELAKQRRASYHARGGLQ